MADERVRILLEARDNASSTINRVGGSLSTLQPQATGITGAFGKLTPVLGAAAGAFAAVGGAAAALDFARSGAEAEALSASFDRMAGAAGQSSDDMLAAMQRASSGTIANTDLILAANRAMSFGVANTGSEMASLIQLSMAQAAKMGISATQAFNDLVTGVGRLSPMILDNLGVTVQAEKAYANYASSIGKAVDQLTQAEQRQAFLNEMMAAAPNVAAEAALAADSNAGAWSRWDANVKNLGDSLGRLLSGPGADLLDWLNAPVNGINNLLNPTDVQITTAAMAETARQIETIRREIDATQGSFRNLGQVAGEEMPIDITMPAPLQYEPDILDTAAIDAAKAKLAELEAAMLRLREVQSQQIFGYAPDPAPWAELRAMGDQWAASAQANAAAVEASYANLSTSVSAQIDSLTKSLAGSMGAAEALALNASLKTEMAEIIGLYQAAGRSAELTGYVMIEWLQREAEEARNASNSLNTYARSAGNAATASARSIAPIRAMAGALRDVAMAAAAGQSGGRMDKWERINYDMTGITPKAYALKDGFDALGATFDSFSASAGGASDSLGGFSAMDDLGSKVQGILGGALSVDVGVNASDFLPREDAVNEDARRLADVMVNGFSSPWASYFQTEFPALFTEMTAGGDIQSGAAAMLQQFQQGLRPELIDQDLVKDRIKAMLVGDANMAALAAEITGELQAELAGMDPAQISGMVNGALGIKTGDTGVGAGIEDELGNAALLTKIEGTGTTAGKSWGGAFLTYVQNNVPAALVGLLVDLVTPGVRAKLIEDGSAGGAVP